MSKQRDQMIDKITGMRIPVAANRVLVITPKNAAFITDYLLEHNIVVHEPTTVKPKTNSNCSEEYRNGWNECLATVNIAAEESLRYAKFSKGENV